MDRPLNCRQGDLAIVVKSEAGNEGKIVRRLEFVGAQEFGSDEFYQDLWRVEGNITSLDYFTGKPMPFSGLISDSRLRPIRDGDGTDETLRLVGLPSPTQTKTPETTE